MSLAARLQSLLTAQPRHAAVSKPTRNSRGLLLGLIAGSLGTLLVLAVSNLLLTGRLWPSTIRLRALTATERRLCNAQMVEIINGTYPLPVEVSQRQAELEQHLLEYHARNGTDSNFGGNVGQMAYQKKMYLQLASLPCVQTVCEVGFGAGHSATVWMAAKDDINLIAFDLGTHSYTYTAIKYFKENFPGRFYPILGASLHTIQQAKRYLAQQCDLIILDGSMELQDMVDDILNMRQLANRAFHVLVVDDVNCDKPWCIGPNKALSETVDSGLVRVGLRVAMDAYGNVVGQQPTAGAERGFTVGAYLFNKQTDQTVVEDGDDAGDGADQLPDSGAPVGTTV